MSWSTERLQVHRGDRCHGGQRGYKVTEVKVKDVRDVTTFTEVTKVTEIWEIPDVSEVTKDTVGMEALKRSQTKQRWKWQSQKFLRWMERVDG